MKKKVNIAIIGLGNIGSFFYLYLKKNRKQIIKKTNVIPNVVYISAKKYQRNLNYHLSTFLTNSGKKTKKIKLHFQKPIIADLI